MNIFILDESPEVAASYHCDQHKNKMILESAQMLSTIVHKFDPAAHKFYNLYKPTHANHPCTLWLAESVGNVHWLLRLVTALNNSERLSPVSHASYFVALRAKEALMFGAIPDKFYDAANTPFVQCMPLVFQGIDAVEAYRRYYQYKAADGMAMTYKNRKVPPFMEAFVSQ